MQPAALRQMLKRVLEDAEETDRLIELFKLYGNYCTVEDREGTLDVIMEIIDYKPQRYLPVDL